MDLTAKSLASHVAASRTLYTTHHTAHHDTDALSNHSGCSCNSCGSCGSCNGGGGGDAGGSDGGGSCGSCDFDNWL